MWWKKLMAVWKSKDLRKNILVVFVVLVVFRLAAHIPIPGINTDALKTFFQQNQILGLLNVFSGGAMENFSVVALGVGPYITASIILQLLTMIIPWLEELSKEGETGRRKINQWTRILTVPLCFLQSYGMIVLLQRSSNNILPQFTPLTLASTMITVTAGTVFLMWLGEVISEKKVGNGISLIIFAGIVTNIPGTIQNLWVNYDPSRLPTILSILALGIVTTAGVVFITEAQRNIPVSYARRIRGMKLYGGSNTHLPLRVNQVGMIPIIFAVSIILFPPLLANFFVAAKTPWVASLAASIISLFQPNHIFYGVLYFFLVVGFTYFYTSIVFQPQQIAENLQKQGGFIPGIRPGANTAQYIKNVSNRIMLAGALFLGAIAVLPIATQQFAGVQNLTIGGSSLIIVVSVVIETVKQIDSQLSMRDYESL